MEIKLKNELLWYKEEEKNISYLQLGELNLAEFN